MFMDTQPHDHRLIGDRRGMVDSRLSMQTFDNLLLLRPLTSRGVQASHHPAQVLVGAATHTVCHRKIKH